MKRRALRSQPFISFFAFQDIITAVTGIVILMALLMALQITKPLTTSTVADPERIALRDSLRDELAVLKLQALSATVEAQAGMADAAASQAEAANLNRLADVLDADTKGISSKASSLESAGHVEIDVEAVRTANAKAAAELKQVQQQMQETTDQIEKARIEVEEAERAVLAHLQNMQDLWLIPERSLTAKEPVIISVLKDRFTIQPVDAPAAYEVERGDKREADLAAALGKLDPSKQYLVFYFRPSTLDDFEGINEKAKTLHYEIGYDLVEEDAQVQFAVAPDLSPPPSTNPAVTSPPGSTEEAAAVDIEKEAETRGEPLSTGSGFFISPEGFIITNDHVVEGGKTIFVGSPTIGWQKAKKVASDAELDLAVLKVEDGIYTHLPVLHSGSVRLGQTVATIGFPNTLLQGISPKCARGEIASLAGLRDDPSMFQISVSVQPGNSGGALFDMRGNVVGVVSGKINQYLVMQMTGTIAENVNFAIKSATLINWLTAEDIQGLSLSMEKRDQGGDFEDIVSDVEKASVMVVVYP